MADDTVKVAVRIRPLVDSERNRGCRSIVQKTPGEPQVLVSSGPEPQKYTYNYVFAPEDTQEMIYENAVKSMVFNLFNGYNVTSECDLEIILNAIYSSKRIRNDDDLLIKLLHLSLTLLVLAYGQTGSGKTHTMGTTFKGIMNEEMGIIPRAVTDIFTKIETMTDHEFTVNCSFVELYNEKCYDLLSPNQREESIVDIRESDNKVFIANLTEKTVSDTISTTNFLMKGSADRVVAATAMNSASSRSHAIFTVTVQKVPKDCPSAATIAKFHMVDLAGSERSKKTQTVGENFREGVNINKGLLALGNVISALGDPKENGGHVGYRDSKLTRLLTDSLGGNSKTLV